MQLTTSSLSTSYCGTSQTMKSLRGYTQDHSVTRDERRTQPQPS